MNREIHGLVDIHTILSHERQLGGAIEANRIRLNTGELIQSPVITHIDCSGGTFATIGLIDEAGNHMIVHVNNIAVISSPAHKRIRELNNRYCRRMLTSRKLAFLKRLCEVNAGCPNPFFAEEVRTILDDIGRETVKKELHPDLLPVIGQVLLVA